MSFINSASIKRWRDILLYAIVPVVIFSVLSKVAVLKKLYIFWHTIFTGWQSNLQILILILTGMTIQWVLAKFKVSHGNRPIGFSLKYPPITLSIILSLPFGLFYYPQYLQILYDSKLIFSLCPLFLGLSLGPLINATQKYVAPKSNKVAKKRDVIKEGEKGKEDKADPTNWTGKEIIEWVKDEQPIDTGNTLLFDRDVYVDRIMSYFNKQKKQGSHIAICGKFGSGKSSIIKAVS
jgi:uncharacterized protein YacL (UPF0231 family)